MSQTHLVRPLTKEDLAQLVTKEVNQFESLRLVLDVPGRGEYQVQKFTVIDGNVHLKFNNAHFTFPLSVASSSMIPVPTEHGQIHSRLLVIREVRLFDEKPTHRLVTPQDLVPTNGQENHKAYIVEIPDAIMVPVPNVKMQNGVPNIREPEFFPLQRITINQLAEYKQIHIQFRSGWIKDVLANAQNGFVTAPTHSEGAIMYLLFVPR